MKVPEEAIPNIKTKMLSVKMAQIDLESYIQGLVQGLKLKGKWNINTSTWEFEKVQEAKE